MTTRKLLELAAKAYGIDYPSGVDARFAQPWNPLDDNGDALRLSVKLGIDIKRHYYEGDYFVKCSYQGNHIAFTEQLNNNYYAATRRAIVRAAAEIGRSMK